MSPSQGVWDSWQGEGWAKSRKPHTAGGQEVEDRLGPSVCGRGHVPSGIFLGSSQVV